MLGTKLLFVCVCVYVCMYVCMYIPHTLINMGSLVAHAYRHDMHVVDSQALHEWSLSSLNTPNHARTRNWKYSVTTS